MYGYGSAAEVELDLHGYSVQDALEEFVALYNRLCERRHPPDIRVIHGYGSGGKGGEIRDRLRAFLSSYPDHLKWVEGEKAENNPGVTLVRPRRPLPDAVSRLASEILDYCRAGKTIGQITTKFSFRYGEPQVKQAVRELEQAGRLKVVYKGKHKKYEAVG